jgi:hypothetical protein
VGLVGPILKFQKLCFSELGGGARSYPSLFLESRPFVVEVERMQVEEIVSSSRAVSVKVQQLTRHGVYLFSVKFASF